MANLMAIGMGLGSLSGITKIVCSTVESCHERSQQTINDCNRREQQTINDCNRRGQRYKCTLTKRVKENGREYKEKVTLEFNSDEEMAEFCLEFRRADIPVYHTTRAIN